MNANVKPYSICVSAGLVSGWWLCPWETLRADLSFVSSWAGIMMNLAAPYSFFAGAPMTFPLLHQLLVKREEEHSPPVPLRICNLEPEACSPVWCRDSDSRVEGRETGDGRRRLTRQASHFAFGRGQRSLGTGGTVVQAGLGAGGQPPWWWQRSRTSGRPRSPGHNVLRSHEVLVVPQDLRCVSSP